MSLHLHACRSASKLERRQIVRNRKTPESDDIRARAVPRERVDLKRLSRALIALALAQAQAEADAEAEHKATIKEDKPRAA
jgi:hypothetical protein